MISGDYGIIEDPNAPSPFIKKRTKGRIRA